MNIPEQLKYTNDHNWIKIDGDKIFIGVTDYGQNDLGDIIFIDPPQTGAIVFAGDILGTLEAAKTVFDICAPISGEILEINEELAAEPQGVNSAPYENWLLAMSISDEGELENLMEAEEYAAYCSAL